jgi:hypothetical protein
VDAHYAVDYSADDIVAFLEEGAFPSTPSYGPPSSEVYVSTSYAGAINASSMDDVPASDHATVDRIEEQSTFDNEDVAIIHVSGMDNMPSIQLDDSSQVAEMDNLTLIGFPGNGDVSEQPTNFLTSSINEIYVSALKTTDQSVPVIQVGGNVEHGDSGGPALDAAGHIVGIVSFGLSDSNDIGETTFLQASASAENLMQAGGVDTTPGPLEKAWTQAFDDYASTAAGHWHKAAAELQDLVDTYPSFLGVTPFLTYAQSQANHEAVPATSSAASSSLLLMLVLVLLLGLFIVTLFLILRRQRLALHGGALSSFPSNIAHTSWYEYTTSPRPSTPAPSPFSGERSNVPLSQTPPAPQLPLAPTQPAASLLQQLPLTPVLPVVPETPAASPTVSEPQTLARTALLVAARPGDDEPLMQPQAHPMSGSVETVGTSDRYAWIAPCGHPNEPDVRFCRTCGRPTT